MGQCTQTLHIVKDIVHCEGHCAMHDVKGVLDFLGYDELRPAGGQWHPLSVVPYWPFTSANG